MRECNTCKEVRRLAEFYKHKRGYVNPKCKICIVAEDKVRYVAKKLKEQKPQFIYVITHPMFNGWVKIGRAIDPERRLSVYQTCSPFRDFEMPYYTYVLKPVAYEWYFEENYKHANKNNKPEWFKMSVDEAIKVIENIKSKENEAKEM